MSQYRWLLLDADNTIFDFDASEAFALNQTMLHFGVTPTPELREGYHFVNVQYWAAFDRGEISQEDLATERFSLFLELWHLPGDGAAWNGYYREALASTSLLLPGAETACWRLASRYTLALTTNGISYTQRKRLEHSPLARYFGDRVFISGEMGCRKPDREYFDAVLNALGARTRRGECLVVGDSLTSDIRGAFNAKLDSAWIRPAGAKPGALHPTYEAETLTQLCRILEREQFSAPTNGSFS